MRLGARALCIQEPRKGTQGSPVATIAQGLTNAATIGTGTDVFVAAGTYAEDVTMVDGTKGRTTTS